MDSGNVEEVLNEKVAIGSSSLEKIALKDDEEEISYGELILLGYNGFLESSRPNSHGRKHRSKMSLNQRVIGNGIKKGQSVEITVNPKQAPAVQDNTRHVVSYVHKSHTVLVEYLLDPGKDMFQVGRSSEEQIDFTIVDTWLAAGANLILSPAGNNNSRLMRSPNRNVNGNNNIVASSNLQKPISSTISRFACRILADRDQPNKTYVYAAGFDSSKNIFLGEKATKWQRKNGEFDGLTTNGVLILHPNRNIEDENQADQKEMYVWREVSVDGDIYSLRETRSSTKRGTLIEEETNQLQDGTLIDLCGATLLWRSYEGLQNSPSRGELEMRLDELNAGKPQCPVNLNTLIVPRKKCVKSSSRQPYVYLQCGHVQGKHNWGVSPAGGVDNALAFKCPICMIESERILQLTMGMEQAFHLDSEPLGYAFNPCGHVASFSTVRQARILHTNLDLSLVTGREYRFHMARNMKVSDLLENILRSISDIQSIMIVDRDGVPIVSAGSEIRNRAQLTTAFTASLEQATKLNLGEQNSWVFHYETHQLVILNMHPIAVFIVANSNSNTSLLCQLRSRLLPAVKECKKLIAEVCPA